MKKCVAKKSFIVCLQVKKIVDKEYEHVLKLWDRFEMKKKERISRLVLKMQCFIGSWYFWKNFLLCFLKLSYIYNKYSKVNNKHLRTYDLKQ